MQIYNGHEILAKYYGNRAVKEVRQGLRLVWQAVRSCFGSGIWVSAKPWLGAEKWKNHK